MERKEAYAAECYILFPSHHQGLALESRLKEQGIKYTVTPTPRRLSSCCGIAIRYLPADEEKIKQIITAHGIQIEGMYHLTKVAQEIKFI